MSGYDYDSCDDCGSTRPCPACGTHYCCDECPNCGGGCICDCSCRTLREDAWY